MRRSSRRRGTSRSCRRVSPRMTGFPSPLHSAPLERAPPPWVLSPPDADSVFARPPDLRQDGEADDHQGESSRPPASLFQLMRLPVTGIVPCGAHAAS